MASEVWIDITVLAKDEAAAKQWLIGAGAIEEEDAEELGVFEDGQYMYATLDWQDADVLDRLSIAPFPFHAVVTYDSGDTLLSGFVWDPETKAVAQADLIDDTPVARCSLDPDTGELVVDRGDARRATDYLMALELAGFQAPRVST